MFDKMSPEQEALMNQMGGMSGMQECNKLLKYIIIKIFNNYILD